MIVTMAGVAAIAIYAVVERSMVMLVSAAAVGVLAYVFRHARMRERLIAIIAAALGGAIAAEIVHTFYYHTNAAEPVADSGNLFLSAIFLGLITAAIIGMLVVLTEIGLKVAKRKSE